MSKRLTVAERRRFKRFFEAALEHDEHGMPGNDANTIKREFWGALKAHLGGNGLSTGLEHMERLVDDLLEGRPSIALRGPVVAMPSAPGVLPESSTTAKSSTSSSTSSAKKPVRGKRKTRNGPPPIKSSKKLRSSDKPDKPTSSLVPSAEYKALVDLNLDAPDSVKAAVYFILAKAEAAEKKPWCLAYPWTGRPQWYNPLRFRAIYRGHWRFWMSHRRAFWEWALYAPLASETAQNNRRKAKMRAVQARVAFMSLCIETWGFYGFLTLLDKCPLMFWMGGQPGRDNKKCLHYDGPLADTLTSLEDKDPDRYQATIDNALEPVQIDAYGYPSIRVLLETTEALVPTAKPANRLSMVALARIRLDLQSSATPRDTWVGSTSDEPWKTLMDNALVKQTQLTVATELESGSYQLPEVKGPTKTERQRADWSDLEEDDEDEAKAVVPTSTTVTATTADSPSADDDADDGEDDDEEVGNDDEDDDEDEYKPEEDDEDDDEEDKAEAADGEDGEKVVLKKGSADKGKTTKK
ncbi:hypothetical protein PInf_025101 [Phytophthora infestans]|nr:hypothetical protein PInf_025101 [Phytophthora infestans]